MDRVSITSQQAQIDIRQQRAQVDIQNPRPRMTMQSTPIKAEAEHEYPSFSVDWRQVRAESGIQSPEHFMSSNTGHHVSQYFAGLDRTVAEGNQMGDSCYTGQTVGSIVFSRVLSDQPEFNIKALPQNMPKITWDTGSLKIHWTLGTQDIGFEGLEKPQVSVTPHSVETYLKQPASIDIQLMRDPGSQMDVSI